MDTKGREQHHHELMRRKKTVIDAVIDRADRDQGLLLALTGNGKGRSSMVATFAYVRYMYSGFPSRPGAAVGLLHSIFDT